VRCRLGWNGGGSRAAVEGNALDRNRAGRLGLGAGLGGIDDRHVLGPATLRILDRCAHAAARGALFAGGSVGHAIVEL
jgi:hypothetical protein